MNTTPPKNKTKQELFESLGTAIKTGNYVFMEYGEKSSVLRQNVNDLQIINILTSSTKKHDAARDAYQDGCADWNYHIIGKTINNEKVRIVLSFDEFMLIIKAINLDEEQP
ncbi:MAG TPA: hypothetical protein ENG03_08300 [Thioploca sp.]|nr:hypothetical protein [Thioploca sp.]